MKPKSMGFSVPLMAGFSEVIPSHKKKKARNTASATSRVRHSSLRNSTTLWAVTRNTRPPTAAPSTRITMMVTRVLGINWVSPESHST